MFNLPKRASLASLSLSYVFSVFVFHGGAQAESIERVSMLAEPTVRISNGQVESCGVLINIVRGSSTGFAFGGHITSSNITVERDGVSLIKLSHKTIPKRWDMKTPLESVKVISGFIEIEDDKLAASQAGEKINLPDGALIFTSEALSAFTAIFSILEGKETVLWVGFEDERKNLYLIGEPSFEGSKEKGDFIRCIDKLLPELRGRR